MGSFRRCTWHVRTGPSGPRENTLSQCVELRKSAGTSGVDLSPWASAFDSASSGTLKLGVVISLVVALLAAVSERL